MESSVEHVTFDRSSSIADTPAKALGDFAAFVQQRFAKGYALTGASFSERFLGMSIQCTFTKTSK